MAKRLAKNERLKRRYFQWLKTAKGTSEATIDHAAAALNSFEETTNRKDFAKFHPEWALRFRRQLSEVKNVDTGMPLSISTVRSRLMAVKNFVKWLADQPGYKSRVRHSDCEYFNLTANEVRMATAQLEAKYPAIEQIFQTIEIAPTNSIVERRDRAIMAFALLSGMRDAAIASLPLGAIDLKKRRIEQNARYVKTKNAKSMITFFFPVGKFFEDIVDDWLTELRQDLGFRDEDPAFPKTLTGIGSGGGFAVLGVTREYWKSAAPIRRIFKSMFKAAGLDYFQPHSFRKTLAHQAYELDLGLEEAKAWSQNLGHEKPITTWISYGKVDQIRTAQILRELSESDDQPPEQPREEDLLKDIAAQLSRHLAKKSKRGGGQR